MAFEDLRDAALSFCTRRPGLDLRASLRLPCVILLRVGLQSSIVLQKR
jgi:hypothetical protein